MQRTAYCAGCGKRKRLTFPRNHPITCTLKCAALTFLGLAEAGADVFCRDCGDHGCDGGCDEN